ncbi:MAG: hypothetical protein ACE5KV_04680, partial [Thermoplasmata archaeon]
LKGRMERRTEFILFIILTFLIPAVLILIDVFLLTDILLIVLGIVWMGFCLAILTPTIRGE